MRAALCTSKVPEAVLNKKRPLCSGGTHSYHLFVHSYRLFLGHCDFSLMVKLVRSPLKCLPCCLSCCFSPPSPSYTYTLLEKSQRMLSEQGKVYWWVAPGDRTESRGSLSTEMRDALARQGEGALGMGSAIPYPVPVTPLGVIVLIWLSFVSDLALLPLNWGLL